jgi:hypothetical protein
MLRRGGGRGFPLELVGELSGFEEAVALALELRELLAF